MKKVFSVFALMMGMVSVATAQTSDNTGDLFEGYTRKITYDRMIPPHGLEVTFDKTCHVIFPVGQSLHVLCLVIHPVLELREQDLS